MMTVSVTSIFLVPSSLMVVVDVGVDADVDVLMERHDLDEWDHCAFCVCWLVKDGKV